MSFSAGRSFIGTVLIITLFSCAIADLSAGENIYTLPGAKKEENRDVRKTNDRKEEKKTELTGEKLFLFSIGVSANTKDVFLKFKTGINIVPPYDIYLILVYDFRPYKNTVFVERDSNHYFQLKENRSALGIGLEKHFTYDDFLGFYLNGGIGYTWSDYAGVKWEAEEGAAPFAGGGFMLCFFDIFVVRAGYEYLRIPNVPDHRGVISFDIKI